MLVDAILIADFVKKKERLTIKLHSSGEEAGGDCAGHELGREGHVAGPRLFYFGSVWL